METRRGSYFWLSLLLHDLTRGHPSHPPWYTLLPPRHPPLPLQFPPSPSLRFIFIISIRSEKNLNVRIIYLFHKKKFSTSKTNLRTIFGVNLAICCEWLMMTTTKYYWMLLVSILLIFGCISGSYACSFTQFVYYIFYIS